MSVCEEDYTLQEVDEPRKEQRTNVSKPLLRT